MDNLKITNTKVYDAINVDYGTVDKDMSLGSVLDLMLENHWTEVIVTDGKKFIGMMSKDRLMRILINIPKITKIKNVCKHKLITVDSDAPLLSARETMRNSSIGCMPVINKSDSVVGIITAKDICNTFSFKLEFLCRHMRTIMDNISEAIQAIDGNGIVTFWNKSAEKIFNIKSDDIVGRYLKDFFHDDLLLKVTKENKSYSNFIMEYKPGLFLLRNAEPAVSESGRQLGAVCTSLDVSRSMYLIDMLETTSSKIKAEARKMYVTDSDTGAFYTVNSEMKHILQKAFKAAKTDTTIFIQGESGTGKEILAYEIYKRSQRHDRPFVEINCSAIPESLFETEMFGYEAGTFTGGNPKGKKGKFDMADGGTLFLDEVADIPLELQPKLLRAIQERHFSRIGGVNIVNVDVRIIAATNRNMKELIKSGKFREDLYYRLNVVHLDLPALSKRTKDIPGLCRLFLEELCKIHQRSVPRIAPEVFEIFYAYPWPGNVRQLRNIIETLVVLLDDYSNAISVDSLVEADLDDLLLNNRSAGGDEFFACCDERTGSLKNSNSRHERQKILQTLAECGNNKAKAAQILGIKRSTLYYKMRRLDIATGSQVVNTSI
jgi:transcriptional regulator with PAS, ATPase and Fis domain